MKEVEDRCLVFGKAEAELADLRDAVAWYFEIRMTIEWHMEGRTDIDCNEQVFHESAHQNAEYCPWCMATDEIYHSLQHAEQQLRSLAGGEDG